MHILADNNIPRTTVLRLSEAPHEVPFDRFAEDPRPHGVVQLTDVSPPLYRVREGHYRILHTINDDRLVVLAIRIGHRSEVYK